jgi:predicted ATP-dependent endonuclease of OLD family
MFARKVVFCEGQDDVFAVRSFLEGRHQDDLDGKSLSIIQVGGVGTLPAFAAMASRLGIPWLVLVDEDLDDQGKIKSTTQKAMSKLTPLVGGADRIAIWPGNLEGCLNTTEGKAKPEWQARHIVPKTMDEVRKECPDYITVCEDIRTWLAS